MEQWVKDRYVSVPKQDLDFFKLIPQEAVKHKIFPETVKLNAMWDIIVSPKGRVFFSLCAELAQSQYVRLYEYLYETNEFKLCFRLEDVVLQQDRAIRPSKIHTSMQFMNDGRLIMATHTTAQAPQHPYWMPYSYFHHQFEGYQGSNILIYDVDTGAVENRGKPVPYESIYGGAYDPKHNDYYFSGMMRMHLYRMDIDKNQVTDMGQFSEYAVYKMKTAPDGNIYTSTKMGRMIRINTETKKIEDLKLQIPQDFEDSSYMGRLQVDHMVWHPNGKMYFIVARHPHLFCYDPKENKLEDLGDTAIEYNEIRALNWPFGIAVDSKGILWYTVTVIARGGCFNGGARLYSFNPETGEKKCYGFVGSDIRTVHMVAEMECHDDILYITDSNHQFDAAGIIAVDLKKLREVEATSKPVYSNDAAPYMCVESGREIYPFDKESYDKQAFCFEEGMDEQVGVWNLMDQNWDSFQTSEGYTYKLWQRVGAESSQILDIHWQDNETLVGHCGGEENYQFEIKSFELTDLSRASDYKPEKPDLSEFEGLSLPFYPGRQYKAVATAAIKMADGSTLIGTEDAMLALYKDGKVFSLGQAAAYGPIHAFATDSKRERVYGVASYDGALGSIFSFDLENGVKQLGRLKVNSVKPDYFADSTEPTTVAVSPDGNYIAFGVKDRLGVVYICRI